MTGGAVGARVHLTHVDRVLWPAAGFTKRDMLAYYEAVAPALVPHLSGRPLTLGRFPEGVDGPGWAQTECRGRPPWMRTMPLAVRGGAVRNHCVVEDLPSLLWVANQGAVELHAYPVRAERPDEPTDVVFDLDPGQGTGLAECCRVAIDLRDTLRPLRAHARTSGSAGLHVVVPLAPGHSFRQTKPFARRTAEQLAADRPDDVVASSRRSRRAGKVFVDWLQNDARRSLIVTYSLRAMPIPAVATPVTWDEVGDAARTGDSRALTFTAPAVIRRVEAHGDLFAGALDRRQRLPVRRIAESPTGNE